MKTIVKLLSVTILAFIITANVQAQVTVGADVAPKHYSVLEISTENVIGGLRLPQLTTMQRDTLTLDASAEGLVIFNTEEDCVNYYNGSKWRSFCEGAGWFYMPSIVIDVTASGTFQKDLHLEYKKQFANPENSLTLVKSGGAPNPFTKIYEANELYYYVTGYDATVFSGFNITPQGMLTYTINADNVSDATYMNIVFAVK